MPPIATMRPKIASQAVYAPLHYAARLPYRSKLPEAITGVFPETVVRTCIVHLIRYSMQFALWKERKKVASALRSVYSAPSAEALDAFEQGEWGQRFPAIVQSWRRRWCQRTKLFDPPSGQYS